MVAESSNIEAIRYDAKAHDLIVTYRGSREYVYRDVPPEIWAGIEAAESVGRYLHEFVKGRFVVERTQTNPAVPGSSRVTTDCPSNPWGK